MAVLPCPACSSRSPEYARGTDGRSYLRCPSCRLVFLDPGLRLPPEEEREHYLLHRNDPSNSGYAAYLGDFIDSSLAPFAGPPARALDYGSGPYPLLCDLLSDRGYTASRWDPFFAPERPEPSTRYDAVAAHEVLEHCSDPLSALRDMAGLLVPGGVLALSTLFMPEGPEAFLSWWYRQDSTHVSFFSEGSLEALCRASGFTRLWSDGRSRSAFRLSIS